MAEYTNKLRLDVIMMQIAQTDRPIKDIVLENGFGTSNYFYTYFKKKTGMTAQVYREKMKKSNS